MRVALFDGIQETHVGASLERALVAAGHEVYSTGRFGAGVYLRDTDELLPTVAPHLQRISDFRPDLVFVFRPGSAPYPVLQALRGTGAVLAAWLSDDPVLFDLSYGPVVDLYDVVLHCGNERVLRFYEEQFGRPTGVNFPFWTDHEAFPAVYGRHEPDTTVMFLGNVVGALRARRYDQLAAMRNRVRVYGQAGEDPAGLGAGFLDTDAEVVDAGSRARLALSIPQFFRDHAGQKTWFDGLDRLGFFELPSRVIQYSAMGLPSISVIPGAPAIPSFPELVVCGSIAEADEWASAALDAGTLDGLSAVALKRFDRSFSAAARVMALEALLDDDGWRSLDAADRATWFLQFDGRSAGQGPGQHDAGPGAGAVAAGPPVELRLTEDTAGAAAGADPAAASGTEPAATPEVVLVHGRTAGRFTPVDVVRRELHARGRAAAVVGPEDPRLRPAPAGSAHRWTVDAGGLVPARAGASSTGDWVLVLAEGVGVTDEDAAALRAAGAATVCLLGTERMTASEAGRYDLVVRVGQAPVDAVAVLGGLPNALHTPALVESGFLEAVRRTAGRDGLAAVRTAADPVSDALLAATSGPRRDLHPDEAAAASLEDLAATLAREVVYLQPARYGRRGQGHPPVLPYALCASPTVLTTRHRVFREPDLLGERLLKASTPAEAALKLSRWHEHLQETGAGAVLEAPRRDLDADRQLAAWFRRARENARADRPGRTEPVLGAAAGTVTGETTDTVMGHVAPPVLRLGRWYALAEEVWVLEPAEHARLTVRLADPSLVAGLRVHDGEKVLAEALFPAGTAEALEILVTGPRDATDGPLSIELLADPRHRLREVATVRVRTEVRRGRRPAGEPGGGRFAVYAQPVPAPTPGEGTPTRSEVDA